MSLEGNGSTETSLVERQTDQDGISNLHIKRLLDTMNREDMLELLLRMGIKYKPVLEEIQSASLRDPTKTKIFVRELAWQTTSDKLRETFSEYGEVIEAAVIMDRVTGRSRGYGFVTFTSRDAAQSALKEPNKVIDGRLTQANLATVHNPFSKARPNSARSMNNSPGLRHHRPPSLGLGVQGYSAGFVPSVPWESQQSFAGSYVNTPSPQQQQSWLSVMNYPSPMHQHQQHHQQHQQQHQQQQQQSLLSAIAGLKNLSLSPAPQGNVNLNMIQAQPSPTVLANGKQDYYPGNPRQL